MKRLVKSSRIRSVLEEIMDVFNETDFIHPYKVIYGYISREISRGSMRVAMYRLRKSGYVEGVKREDEICFRLTEKGRIELQRRKQKKKEYILIHSEHKKEQWDGLWRVVIFDIPEENKRLRNVLRQTLKVLEFKSLQKSVWISKRNYTNELRKWVEDLKLARFILIFETKDLGCKYIT